jgi:hypothetical protein
VRIAGSVAGRGKLFGWGFADRAKGGVWATVYSIFVESISAPLPFGKTPARSYAVSHSTISRLA